MTADTALAGTETAIRTELDAWADAVRARDIARIFSHYDADIVAFDAIAQLQFKGADAYRAHWERCMAMCPGPMIFELHEVQVAADEELAFGHALVRCGGTDPDDKETSGWMRMTACYRRRDGRWRVIHEHFSAPFDPQDDKVLWLEP